MGDIKDADVKTLQNGNDEKKVKSKRHSAASVEVAQDFHIKNLHSHLKIVIREHDGEVDMDAYIETFHQLNKFFCVLGTVFSFVGSDVKSKLEILQSYRTGEVKHEYETLEKMINYEKRTQIIETNKEASGSRTFLRLHRALIFIAEFLSRANEIPDEEGTSHVCKSAYNETLAKFHPWLIRKGATLAMYTLPTKKDLVKRVSDEQMEAHHIQQILNEVIEYSKRVYDQCEKLYVEHELTELP